MMTGSKLAAVVGVSTHDSPMSMWLKMHGDIPWAAGTAETARGHQLEAAVLGWWRREHGVAYRAMRRQVWIQHHDLPWAGATLDGLVELDDGPMIEHTVGSMTVASPNVRRVVVEAKTSAKSDEWGEPGTDQVPIEYLTQAYWSLALMPDVAEVRMPVLTSYLSFDEYVIPRNDDVQAELVDVAARFMASLDAGTRPRLDDHIATRAALRALHPDIERDTTAFLPRGVGEAWLAADRAAKDAAGELVAAQIAVLDAAGVAHYVATHDGLRVGRRQPNGHGGISLVPIHPKGTR